MTHDEAATIDGLRAHLARYPKSSHPVEHATIQFNLGLALAESTSGDREPNLRAAIEAHAEALDGFDSTRFPLQRARVLNALGTVERELGMTIVAIDRFRDAVGCLDGSVAHAELGSTMNNLGLTLADAGDIDGALDAYEQALQAFDEVGYARQRATTLVNRGLAHAARDTVESLTAAVLDYDHALALVDPESAPYVHAHGHHSRGVALMAQPDDRQGSLAEAIRSFDAALSIFTRQGYSFQHAITRHNLGLAFMELAPHDPTSLRRSLSALEEAASILDPRIHREQWLEVTSAMERAHQALRDLGDDRTRVEHFAALVASVSLPERLGLLRYRLRWLLDLREPHRTEALRAHDRAIVRLKPDDLADVSKAWISVLMEQPHEQLEAGLRSRQDEQAALEGEQLQAALSATEDALGELETIQRVRVRDMLAEMGYERPEGR